jgi:hypothetical protein
MIVMPDVAVELSLALPGDAPVWEDISGDFQAITTFRGRQKELDRYQPGTATITLDNAAAKYDPNNGASPYAGHVKPMRRIRITATYAAVTYPIFDGYIDAIDQEYDGPNIATAVISGTDAFKVLAAAALPPSAYAAEVLADGPAGWWRLGEPVGARVAFDAVGTMDLDVYGSPDFGAEGLVSRDADTAATTSAADQSFRRDGGVIAAGPLSVEMIYRGAAGGWLAQQLTADGRYGFILGLNVMGPGLLSFSIGGGITYAHAESSVDVDDGLPHHIVGTWAADGYARVYVDGVLTGTSGVSIANGPTGSGPFIFAGDALTTQIGNTYDEVAVYDYALSAARIAVHAEARATPWNNDLPGQRADRILDIAAWPAGRRDVDDGVSVLAPAALSGSALDYLQKVAESEFGVLFVTGDGTVRLIARHALRNQPELFTFSDHPLGGGHLPYMGQRPEYTDALIRNEATVSRSEGVAQTVRNEDSIAEYLTKSYVAEGLLYDSDDLSRYAAQHIVAEYAEPLRRISQLTVSPIEEEHTAELFPAVLGLELTNEVTVIERPPGGITITQDSVIEGIGHSVAPGFWETTFNLSPAGTDLYWQIGVPGHSEIGLTTRVGF